MTLLSDILGDNGLQPKLAEGAFADGDKTKLDGVENGATADQSGAEIKSLYEAQSDTNAFTNSEKTKLADAKVAFDSVSDMKASTNITIGDYVRTLGYNSAGDGGGAAYEIVEAATGTDDGGSYIDLTGISGQARLLHNGIIHAEQFGAVNGTEASAEIQAAWDALVAWRNANTSYEQSWFFHRSSVTIANQVSFSDSGSVSPDGMNFDLRGSAWEGVSGGDLSDTNPILHVRCPRCVQYHGKIEGGKAYAGIDFQNNAGARIFYPEVKRYKGKGIRVRSSSGSMAMWAPQVAEYDQNDAEYTTQANFTGTGFSAEDGDFNVYNANILWNNIGVYLDADAVQVHFVEAHIVMGNAVDGGANPFVDGILVENHATRENHFDNCYFDNGVVDDYTCTLNINGGHYVANNRSTLTEPKIRLYATSASQSQFDDLRINNVGGLATVGYEDNGASTWDGDMTLLAAEYSDMADENRDVSVKKTGYNIYTSNPAKVEWNFKPSGKFRYEYNVGADQIFVTHDPGSGVTEFSGKLSAEGWVEGDGGELTISSGSITPTHSYHIVDTESDAANDDLATIDTTNWPVGKTLILQVANSSRAVTIKHATGNIVCGADVTLSHGNDAAMFIRRGGNVCLVGFESNF